MIGVKLVEEFPHDAPLGPFAEREIKGRKALVDEAMRRSFAAWVVTHDDKPLFICGVWRLSLIGSGTRVWFVAFRDFYKHLRIAYAAALAGTEELLQQFGPLSVTIDAREPRNARFVEHLGFEFTGKSSIEDGTRFNWYFLR